MARVTRSTHKELQSTRSTLDPSVESFEFVPPKVRQVLGEIGPPNPEENENHPKDPVDVELKGLKAAFRSAIGIKKKKKPKKARANTEASDFPPIGSDGQFATMEYPQAAPYLPDHTAGATNVEQEPSNAPTRMTRSQVAKQPADGVRRELEELINIPQVRAHLELQPQIQMNIDGAAERDVKMLSPTDDKAMTSEMVHTEVQTLPEKAVESGGDDDDSFAKVITSRSPAKPVSRVEDFVDKLDTLEDMMEALDEAISPNVAVTSPGKAAFLSGKHGFSTERASRIFSPTDAELAKLRTLKTGGTTEQNSMEGSAKNDVHRSLRAKSKEGLLQVEQTSKHALRKAKSTHFEMTSRTISQSTAELSTASRDTKRPRTAPSVQIIRDLQKDLSRMEDTRGSAANKRPASMMPPPKQPVKSTKTPTRTTFELPGEAVARKIKEQREARRAQRESEDLESRAGSVASRIRSTKAPTKASFELPGEAISRRKREAHEARLKIQEEEEKKRREFKARPARSNFVANGGAKETTASLARKSMVGLKDAAGIDNGKQMANNVPKRSSTVGARSGTNARRPLLSSTESIPSTSNARLPPAALLPHRNLTPHAAIVGTARPVPSTSKNNTSMTGLPIQRSDSIRKVSDTRKGKEIYQRQGALLAEIQREKREKEEIAKKTREEAAERGRVASREWAEKQSRKGKVTVDSLGPGFGPGGQMGLRS